MLEVSVETVREPCCPVLALTSALFSLVVFWNPLCFVRSKTDSYLTFLKDQDEIKYDVNSKEILTNFELAKNFIRAYVHVDTTVRRCFFSC